MVSTQRPETGKFEVVFDRDVRDCAYLATVGVSGWLPPKGSTGVMARTDQPKAVLVTTHDPTGTNNDRGFHLAVLGGATMTGRPTEARMLALEP